jgi:excisionase family DNA binding protein
MPSEPTTAAVETVSPLLKSVEQAIERLGLSRDRLYAEIGSGRLQSVRSGRRRYFTDAQLDAFVSLLEAEAINTSTRSA